MSRLPGAVRSLAHTQFRSVTGAGLFTLSGAAFGAIGGFVTTVLVTRLLHTSGAGLFFGVIALFTIAFNVAEMGADTGLLRSLPPAIEGRRLNDLVPTLRGALLPVAAVSLLLGAATWFAAPWLAGVFFGESSEQGVSALRTVAPFLVLAAPASVTMAGTRGLGSIKAFTGIWLALVPALRVVLLVAVSLAGLGLLAALSAWALPLVVALVLGLLLLRWQVAAHRRGRASEPMSLGIRRRFWGYAAPRGLSSCLEISLVWSDVLVVSAMAGSSAAGIYAAASRFITTGTMAQDAMRVVTAPRLSGALSQHRRSEAQALQTQAASWIVLVSWPIYLTLAVFGGVLLKVFGDAFVEGTEALAILACAMLVTQLAGNVQTLLLMSGHSGWQLFNKALMLPLNLVLNLVLVPRYGIVGAAVAWSVVLVLDCILAVVQVRVLAGVRATSVAIVRTAVVPLAAFGGWALVVVPLMGRTLTSFFVYAVLSCATYAAVVWVKRVSLGLWQADDLLEGERPKPATMSSLTTEDART